MKSFPIKPIHTKQDYEAALLRVERLMEAEEGSPEADELEVLATLVDLYEEKNFPISDPDPVEALRFRMEQEGISEVAQISYLDNARVKVKEIYSESDALSISPIGLRKIIDSNFPKEIENLASLLANISKILLGAGTILGIFIIFIYCQRISYYPLGLSIVDILPFILLVLFFAIFYGSTILISFLVAQSGSKIISFFCIAIYYIFKKIQTLRHFQPIEIQQKIRNLFSFENSLNAITNISSNVAILFERIYFFVMYFMIYSLVDIFGILLIIYFWKVNKNFANGLIGLIFSLFVILLFTSSLLRQKRRNIKFYSFMIISAVFLSFLIGGIQSPILNVSMKALGFLQEDVTILLPEQQYKIIQSITSSSSGSISTKKTDFNQPLKYDDSKAKILMPNSCILFQGIGDRSFVQFNTISGSIRSIVPTKDLMVYKNIKNLDQHEKFKNNCSLDQ
jgi:HTH-type transcriptional regulator / antitoxin HigA